MKLFRERDDDLVVLAAFTDDPSAHSLRILLEAHGIQVAVVGEEVNSQFGAALLGPVYGVAKVQVLVKRADLEESQVIMNQVPSASEVLIPEWTCGCGESVDAGFSVCWSCGHPFSME